MKPVKKDNLVQDIADATGIGFYNSELVVDYLEERGLLTPPAVEVDRDEISKGDWVLVTRMDGSPFDAFVNGTPGTGLYEPDGMRFFILNPDLITRGERHQVSTLPPGTRFDAVFMGDPGRFVRGVGEDVHELGTANPAPNPYIAVDHQFEITHVYD